MVAAVHVVTAEVNREGRRQMLGHAPCQIWHARRVEAAARPTWRRRRRTPFCAHQRSASACGLHAPTLPSPPRPCAPGALLSLSPSPLPRDLARLRLLRPFRVSAALLRRLWIWISRECCEPDRRCRAQRAFGRRPAVARPGTRGRQRSRLCRGAASPLQPAYKVSLGGNGPAVPSYAHAWAHPRLERC